MNASRTIPFVGQPGRWDTMPVPRPERMDVRLYRALMNNPGRTFTVLVHTDLNMYQLAEIFPPMGRLSIRTPGHGIFMTDAGEHVCFALATHSDIKLVEAVDVTKA